MIAATTEEIADNGWLEYRRKFQITVGIKEKTVGKQLEQRRKSQITV